MAVCTQRAPSHRNRYGFQKTHSVAPVVEVIVDGAVTETRPAAHVPAATVAVPGAGVVVGAGVAAAVGWIDRGPLPRHGLVAVSR